MKLKIFFQAIANNLEHPYPAWLVIMSTDLEILLKMHSSHTYVANYVTFMFLLTCMDAFYNLLY